jgi:hypothetical protein
MDPRIVWKLGVGAGGLGLVVSLVMMLISDGVAAAPWQLGALGFGATGAIAGVALWLSRPR